MLHYIIFLFITYAVLNKLVLKSNDWLFDTLVYTVSWSAGKVASQIIKERDIKSILRASIIVFFLSAFIFGVILNMTEWEKIVLGVVMLFGMALYISD